MYTPFLFLINDQKRSLLMKIKTWIQEGEKTMDVLSSKESAYTDRIIIVNKQEKYKENMTAEISPSLVVHPRSYMNSLPFRVFSTIFLQTWRENLSVLIEIINCRNGPHTCWSSVADFQQPNSPERRLPASQVSLEPRVWRLGYTVCRSDWNTTTPHSQLGTPWPL